MFSPLLTRLRARSGRNWLAQTGMLLAIGLLLGLPGLIVALILRCISLVLLFVLRDRPEETVPPPVRTPRVIYPEPEKKARGSSSSHRITL